MWASLSSLYQREGRKLLFENMLRLNPSREERHQYWGFEINKNETRKLLFTMKCSAPWNLFTCRLRYFNFLIVNLRRNDTNVRRFLRRKLKTTKLIITSTMNGSMMKQKRLLIRSVWLRLGIYGITKTNIIPRMTKIRA